jgi:hypothetical protein
MAFSPLRFIFKSLFFSLSYKLPKFDQKPITFFKKNFYAFKTAPKSPSMGTFLLPQSWGLGLLRSPI